MRSQSRGGVREPLLGGDDNTDIETRESQEKLETQCEQVLMETYTSLNKCIEFLPQSKCVCCPFWGILPSSAWPVTIAHKCSVGLLLSPPGNLVYFVIVLFDACCCECQAVQGQSFGCKRLGFMFCPDGLYKDGMSMFWVRSAESSFGMHQGVLACCC